MARVDKGKTLRDYTKEVVAIFRKYSKQGTKPWSYQIAAHDLSYQVGSLSKILLQMENYRYREGKTPKELQEKAADELADIFAEVLFIAHGMGISLDDAWNKMLASDNQKIRTRAGKI